MKIQIDGIFADGQSKGEEVAAQIVCGVAQALQGLYCVAEHSKPEVQFLARRIHSISCDFDGTSFGCTMRATIMVLDTAGSPSRPRIFYELKFEQSLGVGYLGLNTKIKEGILDLVAGALGRQRIKAA